MHFRELLRRLSLLINGMLFGIVIEKLACEHPIPLGLTILSGMAIVFVIIDLVEE
ncbi:MAG: hypothetical protein QW521_01985 [Desulfurococcaceae archaeon]